MRAAWRKVGSIRSLVDNKDTLRVWIYHRHNTNAKGERERERERERLRETDIVREKRKRERERGKLLHVIFKLQAKGWGGRRLNK
jgi:hypothetical protein